MKRTIKQAAEETGLSADTLRYYEKEGMIAPKRYENRYRYYDENDIAILKNIVVMKYARFTHAEMKSMEELYTSQPFKECSEIARQVINTKINELTQTISNYLKIVMLLEAFLPMLESPTAYQCNLKQINDLIRQIFNDVQRGNQYSRGD